MNPGRDSAAAGVSVWIEGVSLIAPGIPDWESGRALLCGNGTYRAAPSVLPLPTVLPAAECRRASRSVKLCLGLGLAACSMAQRDPASLPSIFCASNPDGHTIHAILESLAGPERLISPTRFHNSVHNAAAGYWSIGVQSLRSYQDLCAFDASFAAGLLEAAVQACADRESVLMLAYDSEYPEPLYACRPIPDAGGIGLVLAPERTARAVAAVHLRLSAEAPAASTASGPPHPAGLADSVIAAMRLEQLGQYIPALTGIPLLEILARRASGSLRLPYLPGQAILADLAPC